MAGEIELLTQRNLSGVVGYDGTGLAGRQSPTSLFQANGVSSRSVAIGVYGQSNELGSVPTTEKTTSPRAFTSISKPSVSVPMGPSRSLGGGWWPYVVDELYAYGYDATVINGAIGGLTFGVQSAGWLTSRGNSIGYSARRLPSGLPGDRGDAGDTVQSSNGTRIYTCTVGRTRLAVNDSSQLDAGNLAYRNFTQVIGTQTTGATEPATFNTAAVGDVVVDNTISWTCISSTGTSSGIFATANMPDSPFLSRLQAGYGFDPLGLLARLHEEMQRVQATRKIIYIQNGQSDLGTSANGYRLMLKSIARFYLNLGYEVMLGNTIYSSGSANSTDANYQLQITGRQNAVTELLAEFPGKVWTGADLYTAMGRTGPMAASGAYMTSDNIHLNGPGNVGPISGGVPFAGPLVATALKAVLPVVP